MIVVARPWCRNGGSEAKPQSLRVSQSLVGTPAWTSASLSRTGPHVVALEVGEGRHVDVPVRRRGRWGPGPASVRSTERTWLTSAGRRLPTGLNGFGSVKTGLSSRSDGTWQVAQPTLREERPARGRRRGAAAGPPAGRGTGAGSVAWKIVTAVTSPAVSSSAHAVVVGIEAGAEPLGGLDAVVVVHRVVA